MKMNVAAVLLTLALAPSAVAEEPEPPQDAVEETADEAPVVDDDRCAALVGAAAQREANRKRRSDVVVRVEEDEDEVLIVHSEPSFDSPRAVRFDEVELVEILEREDDAPGAVVALSGALQEACGVEKLTLGVDDSIGKALQIAWIGDQGALLMADEDLVWLDADGETPTFQMVWRSSFSVDVEVTTTAKRGKAKRASKAKKKPKRSRKKK
jgi:hypothetical protein